MELSVYDDSSTDGGLDILERNRVTLEKRAIAVLVSLLNSVACKKE